MTDKTEVGDIISTEIVFLPQTQALKEPLPEKGNLAELADNVADSIADGIETVADKVQNLISGNNGNNQNEEVDQADFIKASDPVLSTKKSSDFDLNLNKADQTAVTYDQAKHTLKDFHFHDNFSYITALNPELAMTQQHMMQQAHHMKDVMEKEDAHLERSFFPMSFDMTERRPQTMGRFRNKNRTFISTLHQPFPYLRRMNLRRPTRKHESKELDKILSQAEIQRENQSLLNKAYRNQIKEVAPEIQTVVTEEELRIDDDQANLGTHGDIRTPPKVIIEDINQLKGKTLDVRGVDRIVFKDTSNKTPAKRTTKVRSNQVSGQKLVKRSERHDISKMPYLTQHVLDLATQHNQEKVPQLGLSLRHEFNLQKGQQNEKLQGFNDQKQEQLNQEKTRETYKPSGYVGMYQ